MSRRFAASLAVVFSLAGALPASAADVPRATILLEVLLPPGAGRVPEAAPPRFVLMETGEIYLGGTSTVSVARLSKSELGPIQKQVAQVRKMRGLASTLTLGPGTAHRRLVLADGKPVEIVATGDPSAAPVALRPLASLLATLEGFGHPSLRPYRATAFRLTAREAPLAGGCWPWTFTVSPEAAVAAPAVVPSADHWPTGAVSGSACSGGKTYQINLRPLLPGEK